MTLDQFFAAFSTLKPPLLLVEGRVRDKHDRCPVLALAVSRGLAPRHADAEANRGLNEQWPAYAAQLGLPVADARDVADAADDCARAREESPRFAEVRRRLLAACGPQTR